MGRNQHLPNTCTEPGTTAQFVSNLHNLERCYLSVSDGLSHLAQVK